MSDSTNSNNWLATAFVVTVVLAALVGFAMIWFGLKSPEVFVKYGAWGDFFGGTLNPILTFITIIGLLLTIALQRQELSMTRKELERSANALEQQSSHIQIQQFESTLFQMLSMLNEIVEAIEIETDPKLKSKRGRDAIQHLWSSFVRLCGTPNDRLSAFGVEKQDSSEEKHRKLFERFLKDNLHRIGHYIRYLSSILSFLEKNGKLKTYHSQIVKSQLSDQELKIILYFCLSEGGKNFKVKAEDSSLFEHLSDSTFITDSDRQLFRQCAFEQSTPT